MLKLHYNSFPVYSSSQTKHCTATRRLYLEKACGIQMVPLNREYGGHASYCHRLLVRLTLKTRLIMASDCTPLSHHWDDRHGTQTALTWHSNKTSSLGHRSTTGMALKWHSDGISRIHRWHFDNTQHHCCIAFCNIHFLLEKPLKFSVKDFSPASFDQANTNNKKFPFPPSFTLYLIELPLN